ncbi:MAG: putative bifunctional diguanylate cyclase/phosphodiesterase, partial [Hyphomonadaceae bacterium]
PAIVGAITIVPNVDLKILTGPPMLLVSITYIDAPLVADMGRSLLLNDLRLSAQRPRGENVVAEPFVTDDNVSVGYLSWTTKHPGHVLLRVILPLVAAALLVAGAGFANMLLGLRRASAELERSESQARHEALHDPLSGLPNRQHFLFKLESLLEARTRDPEQRVFAAYIDVDRFKDINDTMGHHAGDVLIKTVSQRLRAQTRQEDFLARFGGDEFAILGVSRTGGESGEALAQRLARAFEAPFVIDGQSISVTASVGIAAAPEHGDNAEELMQHADIALYEAKSQGRDRAILFASSMGEKIARRRLIEVELRAAIERDELELHYQPLIQARSGKIGGVEALLRWTHPTHGPIAPASFIPVAEEFGLMGALGDWVLRRAMQAAKRWPDLEMSVNLSPVQSRHTDLLARLRQMTREYDVAPEQIVLEITEGVLMDTSKGTRQTLDALRDMGFKLALDDFGTGYSSLAYLCQFKFDKIKIDRTFVAGFARGDVPQVVLTSVVALGAGLGMDIVAEGVETEFDALTMRYFGCTELQGYYFSKAVDSKALDALLMAESDQRSTHAYDTL